MTAPLRRRQPPELPPIAPEQTTRLRHPEGGELVNITPALAREYEAELRRFVAAAEPWHLYQERVKDYAECRCGVATEKPGRNRWMWRRITGPRYAALRRTLGRPSGHGARTESLCPTCQQRYGLVDRDTAA